MNFDPYRPSYECGRRLEAAGCPLDYLEDLPRKSAGHRKRLYVRELDGVDACVIDRGLNGVGYMIPLALGTDLGGGNIISTWNFVPPWDHNVDFDYEPRDIILERDHDLYASLFKTQLTEVLNERRLLRRGHPVKGVLCGLALHRIPVPIYQYRVVNSQISITDETGHTIVHTIALTVDHSVERASQRKASTAKRRESFEKARRHKAA